MLGTVALKMVRSEVAADVNDWSTLRLEVILGRIESSYGGHAPDLAVCLTFARVVAGVCSLLETLRALLLLKAIRQ